MVRSIYNLNPLSLQLFNFINILCSIMIVSLVRDQCMGSIAPILEQYQHAKEAELLLQIGFTTLADYLWLLRAACQVLKPFHSSALLYLAAAVADFYVPSSKMVSVKYMKVLSVHSISLLKILFILFIHFRLFTRCSLRVVHLLFHLKLPQRCWSL